MLWRVRRGNWYSGGYSGPGFGLYHALLAQSQSSCLLRLSHLERFITASSRICLPSEKLLMASIFLCLDRYARVTSGDPSLIIRWTVTKLLNTTVHVESRNRFCKARNTSPTPASPECVAIRICSMYLCSSRISAGHLCWACRGKREHRTLILAGRPSR